MIWRWYGERQNMSSITKTVRHIFKYILLHCCCLKMRISNLSHLSLLWQIAGRSWLSTIAYLSFYFIQLFKKGPRPLSCPLPRKGTNKLDAIWKGGIVWAWHLFNTDQGQRQNTFIVEIKTHYHYYSLKKGQKTCKEIKACVWVMRTALYCIVTSPLWFIVRLVYNISIVLKDKKGKSAIITLSSGGAEVGALL